MPWSAPRRDKDTPDPKHAEAQLEQIRKRRPQVERLVEALLREKRLNSFTANVTVVLRGGRDDRHAQ